MPFRNGKIGISFGSQTGNAQDLAERIWRESKRFYFQSRIRPLDEYDNVNDILRENCIIFVCSTTGQGEEPDNMRNFWKCLLRKSLPNDLLSHLRFAVFGLGDSGYAKFNFVAKRLHKRLLQLGARPLVELGLGDDQHDLGYEASADPWIENLYGKLLDEYPLPSGLQPLSRDLPLVPRWNVTSRPLLQSDNKLSKTRSVFYSTRKTSEFDGVVLENGRQTDEGHFQDVRLIRFRTEGQKYGPGDLVVLRPKNLPWKVAEFKNVLADNGLDLPDDTLVKLSENGQEIPVPEALRAPVTFRQLCEEYFDLFSIPRRHVFRLLAQITDSDLEKEKCLEFCSAEGQQDMFTYTNRPKRNIVEVLADFPRATRNITLETLFEILPPIKPREFSIASSFREHENEVHILVAVVKYKTKLAKERVGLCSNFLASLETGDNVTMWLKHGSFRFPTNLDVPVLMVGPGTGVAPFRNFIFEISESNPSTDNLILFYGCRNETKDFLCKNEFERMRRENKLNLICAFSRDQVEKIYVQDKIVENGETVWRALGRNAYIFVAGNSKNMPQQVREAFIAVGVQNGKLSEPEAEKLITIMEKQGRYQTECWS